jgi:hypothetical protein
MSTEHAANPTSEARDESGRFKTGNRGGPGNPFARQVAALRQAILERLTPQDVQEIVGSLISLAKEGNFQAAKLLFAYGIGKPQPAPEPDEGNDYREATPMKQDAAAVVGAGEPGVHLNQVRLEVEERAKEEPSPVGVNGGPSPSGNGNHGAPSPNRKQRRAQRKRDRAQRKRDRAKLSTNGELKLARDFASAPAGVSGSE